MARISTDIELPERYFDPRHVASGGMAAVFAAQDAVLGRAVAVKVLAEHFLADPDAVRRFQREARAAARVSQHPHVVTIFDVGEYDGRPFIVMELMDGGSLAAVLRGGRPSREDALRWVKEAASALDHAHERGVVHRDVKPANLLLDERGRLGVADFGIARLAFESSVTQTGQVLGTAAYVSPEQVNGHGANAASDRYSLAVVAYELLTGAKPFPGGTFAAQARQHLETDPVPATAHASALAPAVDGVLLRGLAKDPQERWPSASTFAQALDGATREAEEDDGETAPLTAPTAPLGRAREPRRRRPVPTPAAVPGSTPARASASRPGPADARATAPRPRPVAAVRAPRPASRSRRGLLVPAALLGGLLLAVVAALALSGGGDGGSRPAAKGSASTRSTAARRTRSQTGSTQAAAPAAPSPASGGGTVSRLNDEGFSLMSQGRYGEAIAPLQRAVQGCGDSRETVCAYALYNLGRSLRLAGRPAEAIPILERRLGYGNQTVVVQAELDAARREAGGAPTGGGGLDAQGKGHGKAKGHGKKGEGD